MLLQCSYDIGIDLWAVGCILAEVYTRHALFPGTAEADQLHRIFKLEMQMLLCRAINTSKLLQDYRRMFLLWFFRVIGLPPSDKWPANAVVEHSTFFAYPAKPLGELMPNVCAPVLTIIKVYF